MADPLNPPPLILLQPLCHLHRFHRPLSSLALSSIVERPERLRAIYCGVASAIARLEAVSARLEEKRGRDVLQDGDGLVKALEGLGLGSSGSEGRDGGANEPGGGGGGGGGGKGRGIVPTVAVAGQPDKGMLRTNKAVRFVHEPVDDQADGGGGGGKEKRYLDRLLDWIQTCEEKVKAGECEIPDGLPKHDLYLCSDSLLAISGALSAVCQAVDVVINSSRPSLSSSLPSTNSFPSETSSTHGLLPPIPVTPPVLTPSDSFDSSSSSDPFSSPSTLLPSSAPEPDSHRDHLSLQARSVFVAVRPPGHHCGEDNPMGFCFVNNVLVAAAHAHLEHGIDRVIILDIDLHHGNGTQEAAMRINADTYREELLLAAGKPATGGVDPRTGKERRGLKICYLSIHDIYSFPCEDGDLDRVKEASVNLSSHGQYIENIHLSPYESESDFYARIYPKYTHLLAKAREFLDQTQGTSDRTMVFVSAGFDACEHELQGMQRHGGKVPVSFYSRFAEDTASFARTHSQGRIVSVLEGGYGDRALTSGAMASVVGMAGAGGESLPYQEREGWWSVGNLVKLEKSSKPKRATRSASTKPSSLGSVSSLPSSLSSSPSSSPSPLSFPTSTTNHFSIAPDAWLARSIDILAIIESSLRIPASSLPTLPGSSSPTVSSGGRTLRDRSLIGKPERLEAGSSSSSSTTSSPKTAAVGGKKAGGAKKKESTSPSAAATAAPRLASARRRSERDGTPTPSSAPVPKPAPASMPSPTKEPSVLPAAPSSQTDPIVMPSAEPVSIPSLLSSSTPPSSSSPPPSSEAALLTSTPLSTSSSTTSPLPPSSLPPPPLPLTMPMFPSSLNAVPTLSSLPNLHPHPPTCSPTQPSPLTQSTAPAEEPKKKKIILKFARPGLDSFPTEMKVEEHAHAARTDTSDEEDAVEDEVD